MRQFFVLCFLGLALAQVAVATKCEGSGTSDECPEGTTMVVRKKASSKTDDTMLDITLKCLQNDEEIYKCTTSEKSPFPNVQLTSFRIHGVYQRGQSGPVDISPRLPENKERERLKPHNSNNYDDVETFD